MDQPEESTPQLYPAGLQRFARPFPVATATNPRAVESSDRYGGFLVLSPTRKRVLLKSPVLEKGTPGSVRGRFGQLAVLPRWQLRTKDCKLGGIRMRFWH